MNKKQQKICDFIRVVRQSFNDAHIIYTYGACYGFYEILKHVFPGGEGYLINEGHVIYKVNDTFYDIDGIFIPREDEEYHILTVLDHSRAESWKDSQRIERMLKKYNDDNK